jgi:hypothetical protein
MDTLNLPIIKLGLFEGYSRICFWNHRKLVLTVTKILYFSAVDLLYLGTTVAKNQLTSTHKKLAYFSYIFIRVLIQKSWRISCAAPATLPPLAEVSGLHYLWRLSLASYPTTGGGRKLLPGGVEASKKYPGRVSAFSYTISAEEMPQSSFGAALSPSITQGR